MATVHQFTQYLFALNHQANAARFAWFNFCKSHCEGGIIFDTSVVNRFICRALSHPYWQNNRVLLSEEVISSLENFMYKKVSEADRRNFNWNRLLNAALTQIVAIEDSEQLAKVIERHNEKNHDNVAKSKVVHDGKKQAIAIRVLKDNSIEVRGYDNLAIIIDGELVPLTQDQVLYYDSNLELSMRHIHHISVAPFTTARFIVNSHNVTRVSGSLIKDHTFQKYDIFTAQLLKSLARVFYPIKRLEQYFIDPQSDPQYQELKTFLERAMLLIQGNHPDSFTIGKNAIERGKMEMDSLYPSDKYLLALIRELESILNKQYGPQLEKFVNNTDGRKSSWEKSKTPEKSDSIATSPSAEFLADAEPIN
ncbi:MAG: hypothetical protein A4S09_00450 [Proteobacteria bacterium SG_bin7]|nr:MAG: hypothetical protein A4S09_00450 [Proteobacteria bacterium SG_bin7]